MPSTSSRNRAQFVAGNLKSPGYRFARAINVGLLPKEDPALREATPQTVSSRGIDEVRKYYTDTVRPDLTAIVVIGDVSAEEAKSVIENSLAVGKLRAQSRMSRCQTCLSMVLRRPRFRIRANSRTPSICPNWWASPALITTIIPFSSTITFCYCEAVRKPRHLPRKEGSRGRLPGSSAY